MESLGGDLPKRFVFCLMFSSLLPNPLVSSFESEAHLNIEQVPSINSYGRIMCFASQLEA